MVLRLLDRLTEQGVRHALGRRFEAVTDEIFHVLRWVLMVGFARFLAVNGGFAFVLIYWGLAALLFGYIASRFLLRPEIPILARTDTRLRRLLQSAANFVICVGAFVAVLWAVDMIVTGVAEYRFAPEPQER